MAFNLIDFDDWERKEYYLHFTKSVKCTYSITVELDVTNLNGKHLYPAMLWLLTCSVNDRKEFRTSVSPEGVGIFEDMHPCYTVLNKERKNFSVIWTEFDSDYGKFLANYLNDIQKYASSGVLSPKCGKPDNTFDVSMLPWAAFTGFNLNIDAKGEYLLPIFTIGQKHIQGGKTLIPLAIQVHHAVCDGYHIGLFLDSLREKLRGFVF